MGSTKVAASVLLVAAVGCDSGAVVGHSRGCSVCIEEKRMLLETPCKPRVDKMLAVHVGICCANSAQTGNWRHQNKGLCKFPMLWSSARTLRALSLERCRYGVPDLQYGSTFVLLSHEGLGLVKSSPRYEGRSIKLRDSPTKASAPPAQAPTAHTKAVVLMAAEGL